MNKKEFLDILRQSLNGEVNSDIIEQNIQYYDQYISSQSTQEEARILEVLGNPRLIAKTIIESEKAAEQKGNPYRRTKYKSGYENEDDLHSEQKSTGKGRMGFTSNLSWRVKLTMILILLIVIILIIVIGRIILGILFTFGVPILLAALLFAMFRKRS
jgi:uncharacterized membrane protein